MACKTVSRLGGAQTCSVIGHAKNSVDRATFLNGFMVRYLDYNDAYLSTDPGHPSDLIPVSFAVGEAERRSGADVLRAILASYGVICSFCDATVTWDRGWDIGFTTVAAAIAAGMLLDLPDAQMAHAVSLAVAPRVALRQIRSGTLSHWKGASSADAASHAVRAAYFAADGLTGPEAPFEGRFGVMEQICGPFELRLDPTRDRPSETDIKLFPFGYYAHSPVELGLGFLGWIRRYTVLRRCRNFASGRGG